MTRLGPNLFADLPRELPKELVQTLLESGHVRIERIVSTGHVSPDGCWYDQTENEWVVVLEGEARLLFRESNESVYLGRGDTIHIPARCKHRVSWTAPDQPTVWLAVFY